MRAVIMTACLCMGFIGPHSCQKIVADYLLKVDDTIVKWLKDPSIQSKKEIFEMLGDYLETLQDLIEKIDLRRESALRPGKTLLQRKQPRYLKELFPEEELKTQYKWKDVDIDDFKRLLKETDLLWQYFKKTYADLQNFLENKQESESIE